MSDIRFLKKNFVLFGLRYRRCQEYIKYDIEFYYINSILNFFIYRKRKVFYNNNVIDGLNIFNCLLY